MKYILLILLLSIVSCSGPEVEFTITNKTNTVIDSVIISNGFDKVKIVQVPINDSLITALEFSDKTKSDGHYLVQSYSGNSVLKNSFGYYTNGSPTNESFGIEVFKDTILVK